MELFKFITTKPDAVTIWNTLQSADIQPSEGYTDYQIRFMMYCVLQLGIDFKLSKHLVSTSSPARMAVAIDSLKDFQTIKQPPSHFPSWVDGLYEPYYMLKQLNIPATSDLWTKLFDRTRSSILEADSITEDLKPIEESITAYKLWAHSSDIISNKYYDIFYICTDLPYKYVSNKAEFINDIEITMNNYLYDEYIFNYSSRLALPQFKLRTSDEASEV